MRFWRLHVGALTRRAIALSIAFAVFMVWRSFPSATLAIYGLGRGEFLRGSIAFPVQNCRGIRTNNATAMSSDRMIFFNSSAKVNERILILSKRSIFTRGLLPVLEGNRFFYDIHYLAGRERDLLPAFTERERGKYIVIIFTSFSDYFGLTKWNKRLLDNYCRSFRVGMILFNEEESTSAPYHAEGFPFKVYTNIWQFKSYLVAKNATVLRLVKAGNVLDSEVKLDVHKWSVFVPQTNANWNEKFEIVARSSFLDYTLANGMRLKENSQGLPVVVHDLGEQDEIHRIYFGTGLKFWPHKLLLLDALGFVTHEKLAKPLDRWIQVDIDDIFVGKSGIRMKKDDVQAMIVTQRNLKKLVPGFQFNLGFSGKYFLHGDESEDEGDEELVRNASEFRWFDHTWAHKQPHLVDNVEDMKQQIILNMEFAKKHHIPVDTSYSVAPHHSGVYPVHDVLYEAWHKASGVQMTSTEQYPNLKPAWRRRGFIYRDIMVVPRQTCGLFTHTLFLDQYPGGKEVLLKSIYGGDLFDTIVTNPVSIFMTHLSNYGNDRLALYAFTNVIKFLQCWTNLRLMSMSPVELGQKYFELFPGDMEPVWHHPCKDARHKEIWPSWKSCNRLPSFVIVGPQKTGTTALHMFLSVHPRLRQNKKNEKSYEETQFFKSENYFNGLDWYMNNFPNVSENSSILLFEKTANYFDSSKAPMRVHALLTDAKIIVILSDPVRRAYSWYQHQRSHDNDVALNIEFYDLLTSGFNVSYPTMNLKRRCLVPGLYAEHLERWMVYFPPVQILTIDGEQLKSDPVQVMEQVQTFIGVKKINYGSILKYSERKGFFCLKSRLYNGHACLGLSKGRKYPPMERKAEEYLKEYYREPNRRLAELLHKIRRPLPPWLRTDVIQ